MDDDRAFGASEWIPLRVKVNGNDRAQIDHLASQTLRCELTGCLSNESQAFANTHRGDGPSTTQTEPRLMLSTD